MGDTLSKELPVAIYSVDYFSLAILNHEKNHIYERLTNSMTTNALDEIHNGYYELVKSRALNAVKPNREIKMDTTLTEAFIQAEKEREKTGYNKITTEHVVLALLSDEFKTETRLKKIFSKAGLTYNILLEKVALDFELNNEDINPIAGAFNQIEDLKKKGIMPESQMIIGIDPSNGNDREIIIKEMMGIGNPIINQKMKRKKGKNGNTNDAYPVISQYCTDITELAKNGKIENLVGCDNEISTIIRTLGRRKKNNVIILGPEGSGKTTIAEGLAHRINEGKVPQFLLEKKLVSLDMTALIAGTTLRGMFEERVKALLDEIKESGKHILLIDNIGEILSDKGKNDYDIAAMISHALDNGEIQVIGTCDFKSYRNTFDKNPSLGRKFSKIIIDAPNIEESIEILRGNKSYYETFHNVKYDDDAIVACAMLAEKYITDRNLPDSAVDVMDEAGSFISTSQPSNSENPDIIRFKNDVNDIRQKITDAKKQDNYALVDSLTKTESEIVNLIVEKNKELDQIKKDNPITITKDDIYKIVSSKTGIPINKLSVNDKYSACFFSDF